MRLAATIATPTINHGYVIHWIKTEKGNQVLPSLSAALAGANVSLIDQDKSILPWFIESTSILGTGHPFNLKVSLIDFSGSSADARGCIAYA